MNDKPDSDLAEMFGLKDSSGGSGKNRPPSRRQDDSEPEDFPPDARRFLEAFKAAAAPATNLRADLEAAIAATDTRAEQIAAAHDQRVISAVSEMIQLRGRVTKLEADLASALNELSLVWPTLTQRMDALERFLDLGGQGPA
jgi:hypothetical protein